MYEIKKKIPRTQRLSKTSVSKTQYFINPLQANEVSAVWGHAATSLILAARESLALMMRPRCHKSETGGNRSVNNNRKVYHPYFFANEELSLK